MRTKLGILIIWLLLPIWARATALTGQIRYANGGRVNGTVTFTLNRPAQFAGPPAYQVSPYPRTFTLTDGVIQPGAQVVGNDVLIPMNTIYWMVAQDRQLAPVLSVPIYVSGATFDIGAAVPTAITSNNVLLGLNSLNVTNLNNIIFVDKLVGATAGDKFQNALAIAPATGGYLDACGFQGAQTIPIDVFSSVTKYITIRLCAANFTFSSSTTFNSNYKLIFDAGAKFIAAGGTTLTLSALIEASDVQSIFGSTGTVNFGRQYSHVPIAWFGATSDCATDNSPMVNNAIKAVQAGGGGHVSIHLASVGTCFLMNSSINLSSNTTPIWLEGQGDSVPTGAPSIPTASGSVFGANTGGVLIDLTGAGNVHLSKFGWDSKLTQVTNPSTVGILVARKTGPIGGCNLCTFEDLHGITLQAVNGTLPLTVGAYIYSAELMYWRNVALVADHPLVVTLGNSFINYGGWGVNGVTSPNTTIATGSISETTNDFMNMELWASGQGPGLWLSGAEDQKLIGTHIWSGVQGTPYPTGGYTAATSGYNAAIKWDGNIKGIRLEARVEGFPTWGTGGTVQNSEFTGSWNPSPSPPGPLIEFTDASAQVLNSVFNIFPGFTPVGALYDASFGTAPGTPGLSQTVAGALAGVTYYVKTVYVANGSQSTPSAESNLAVSINNVLNVASPTALNNTGRSYNVYVSTSAGTETKQNTTPIPIGTAWVEPTSGLISGTALPGTNLAGVLSFAGDDFYVGGIANALNFTIGQFQPGGYTFAYRNLRVLYNPASPGAPAAPTVNLVGAVPTYDINGAVQMGNNGVTYATLSTFAPPNGTIAFCTNCNSSCSAGASTGKMCFRENGAWVPGGGGGNLTAAYLLIAADGTLANARTLTIGSGLSYTDGGPSGNFNIFTSGSSSALSSITPLISSSAIANGNFTWTLNFAQTSDSQSAIKIAETTPATGGTLTNALPNQANLESATGTNSTSSPLKVNQGSITNTVATPAAVIQMVWNNGSLVGQGLIIDITDTASAAGSRALNIRKGNTTQLEIRKNGDLGSLNTIGAGGLVGARTIFMDAGGTLDIGSGTCGVGYWNGGSPDTAGSRDTCIGRISAGLLGIGTGAAGASDASLKLAGLQTVGLLISATVPTISSGFGTSPSVTVHNGTAAFRINVGTGGSATSGVIGLPAATTGWNCFVTDITTTSATVFITKQTASSTTSATIGNFNTSAAAAAWVASDILAVSCFAY